MNHSETRHRLDRRHLLGGSAAAAVGLGLGGVSGARAGELPAADSSPIFYRSATVDGLRLFYREAGAPDAPTIVLLHGFPSSSHMFRGLIPLLADRFHLVAPDYPGFGHSDAPRPDEFVYSFDRLYEVVERFLTGLGLDRYSLYVQDYGAPVGFRLASRHPERIAALIVQNGNAYEEGLTEESAPLRTYGQEPRSPETDAPIRAILQPDSTIYQYTHGVADPERISPDAWTMDQLFLDRPGNDEIQLTLFHNYLSNIRLYPEWHAYFRAAQPPTLIVWGQNDPIFGVEGARAFERDLVDVEVHLLDTGHFALEDHAAEIAGHIRRFLEARLGADD